MRVPVRHRPNGPLHIDNRAYNRLITTLRAPTERGKALLSRWQALGRVTLPSAHQRNRHRRTRPDVTEVFHRLLAGEVMA